MKKLKGTTTPFDFKSFIKTGQSVLDLQLKKAREEAPEVAQHTIDLVTKQTSIKQMNSVREDVWEERYYKLFGGVDSMGDFKVKYLATVKDFIRTLLEEAKAEYEKTRAEEVMEAAKMATVLERNRCLEVIGGEWIDNSIGEVDLYTCGRRDERKDAVKAISDISNKTKE